MRLQYPEAAIAEIRLVAQPRDDNQWFHDAMARNEHVYGAFAELQESGDPSLMCKVSTSDRDLTKLVLKGTIGASLDQTLALGESIGTRIQEGVASDNGISALGKIARLEVVGSVSPSYEWSYPFAPLSFVPAGCVRLDEPSSEELPNHFPELRTGDVLPGIMSFEQLQKAGLKPWDQVLASRYGDLFYSPWQDRGGGLDWMTNYGETAITVGHDSPVIREIDRRSPEDIAEDEGKTRLGISERRDMRHRLTQLEIMGEFDHIE